MYTEPVVALVGRPNVGKSTLFNALTRTKKAIVSELPGLTRDRQYAALSLPSGPAQLVDFSGLEGCFIEKPPSDHLRQAMQSQAELAIRTASLLLFVTDGGSGPTALDFELIQQFRRFSLPILLVVNKSEKLASGTELTEFFAFGLQDMLAVSATQGLGLAELRTWLSQALESKGPRPAKAPLEQGTQVAVVGRPNVGKSTLINHLIGENRVIACDLPGTTRDAIEVPWRHQQQAYTLIDTAGLRRKRSVSERLEKIISLKTISAIEQANVVILMLDGVEGLCDQDISLLRLSFSRGKSVVLAVNKWDRVPGEQRQQLKLDIQKRLAFASFLSVQYISATQGLGIKPLLHAVKAAKASTTVALSTAKINQLLRQAILKHPPPLIAGRRIKLKYAHLGAQAPPTLIVHGNQLTSLPDSYKKYLNNFYQEHLQLQGTALCLKFQQSVNPYEPLKKSSQGRSKANPTFPPQRSLHAPQKSTLQGSSRPQLTQLSRKKALRPRPR